MKTSIPAPRSASLALLLFSLLTAIPAGAKSMLWKLEKNGHTLYVQGSAHVLTKACYPLAPTVEQAYSNATALVLEADVGRMSAPQTQQMIMQTAVLKQPDTLQSVLAPKTYEALKTACAEAGIPLAGLERFKPWLATLSLSLTKMHQLGFDDALGLDKHFYDRATKEGKRVVALESIKFQIGLFDSLAKENPNDFVNQALRDVKTLESDVAELIKAWKTGDTATIDKLIKKSFDGYPKLYEEFIVDRNKAWAKKLAKMAKDDETYMVVVGAAHLPGEEGLLNLLAKKGFAIEQL